MTGEQSLLCRAALGIATGSATFLLPSIQRFYSGTVDAFDRRLRIAYLATRLSLYSLVFLVLRISPRGDIRVYFYEAGRVLAGGIPYRDFTSFYAPLHTIMDASVLLIWRNPAALVALPILFEFTALYLWLKSARLLFPRHDRTVRAAALLYLAFPASVQFVCIDGQDTIFVGLCLALAVFLALRYREFWLGAALAAGCCLVKILPTLYAPVFFLELRRRWRMALGFLLVVVAVYGGFLYFHLDVWNTIRMLSLLNGAGGLPYLAGVLFNIPINAVTSARWNDLLYLALALIYLGVWRVFGLRRRLLQYVPSSPEAHVEQLRIVFCSLAAVDLTQLFLARQSWPNYLLVALFPICFVFAAHRPVLRWPARLLFATFGFISIIEHSYYEEFLHHNTPSLMRQALAAHSPAACLFLPVEIGLIVGYAWLLLLALRSTFLPLPPAQGLETVS